jgi:DNA-binding beta-propeller fold protein YncE
LTTFAVGTDPVDVAIDPGTNTAVIVNQGSNNVSIVSLSNMRSPQVLQVSRQVSAPDLWATPDVTVNSTITLSSALTTPATYSDQTLTIVGKGFTGSTVARLDGDSTNVQVLSVSDRVMEVKVLEARLQLGGPRRYALDVANGGTISNVASFTVIQAVDLIGGTNCSAAPQGVAIDSSRNLAVVSNAGCNSVAIIDLATGTGSTVSVGTNPQGVAMHVQSGLAVVANQGSSNASIVDVVNKTAVSVSTDPEPMGVAIDQGSGRAVVTASKANVIDLFTVTGSDHTFTQLPVQQRPVAVAIDPTRHLAAVANTSSNTVSLVDLTQATATEHIAASGLPAGIAFDPDTSAFLTAASLSNRVLVLDPVSRSTFPLRVGINPTSIAYNFASSTLVTTNSSSQTMSVVDFIEGRVRAVLRVRPSGQFAVDIHPFTNLAVIADSAGNRVLLRPLPH